MIFKNKKVAKFEKVSYEQFKKDFIDCFNGTQINISLDESFIRSVYDNIKLPKRATKSSAGYDFFSPISFTIEAGQTLKFPTGIRCKMNNNIMLILVPRSGLGFKYRYQLDNTIGVIDADYYNAKNEGHIMAKVTNDSKVQSDKTKCDIKSGTGVLQGLFLPYFLAEEEKVNTKRIGGFGSTTK